MHFFTENNKGQGIAGANSLALWCMGSLQGSGNTHTEISLMSQIEHMGAQSVFSSPPAKRAHLSLAYLITLLCSHDIRTAGLASAGNLRYRAESVGTPQQLLVGAAIVA